MGLKWTGIVVLPIVVLAIAGCGGGGSDSSDSAATGTETTTALTPEELIEKGDAICADVNAAVGAIDPESPDATAQIAAAYRGMVKDLRALGNPDKTEWDYGEYLRALRELEIAENELKLALKRSPSEVKAAVLATEGTLGDLQAQAANYGFKECGEGPSAPTSSGA
jgi:hypothetical protein